MFLKNNGDKKAVLGCGQFNLEIKPGETKEIPDPLADHFFVRFPHVKRVEKFEEPKPDLKKDEVKDVVENIIRRRGRPRKELENV